jgi:exopolysaccharide biosynthesis WecB/TagA/CpsF family protein
MRLSSYQPEPLGGPPEGRPLAGARGSSESVIAKVSEEGSAGHVLRCGKIHFWSVPLEFLFEPKSERFTHVVTVHAEIFALAHEDEKLGAILAKTLNTIDGRVLQGICKLLYPNHEILRQNGSNFIFDLAKYCREHSEKLYLLGASEGANLLAAQRLRGEFPGLRVSGFSAPLQEYPFDPDWNADILDRIAEFAPQHVVVCFGPRKQEYWIHENSARLGALGVRCAYGLGGTIDFLAGLKPRAPRWIEFIGTEWLFRLACEPRARFGRTLKMFKMPFYAARTVREIMPVGSRSTE